MQFPTSIHQLPRDTADEWLNLATNNIQMEYPHMPWIVANSADDYLTHRECHPTFFGSFDWHSCVEMYWVAVRLMRLFPELPNEANAIATIDALLTPEHIAREAAYCAKHKGFERPYGWGWLLKLQAELDGWNTANAQRWAKILAPLSAQLRSQFSEWLPKLTYAQRIGMHSNTAFGLWLSLPDLQRHDPELRKLVSSSARRWFTLDTAYPFRYEPSGADFLSAGLCEAVLMRNVLSAESFAHWIEGFLPAPGTAWIVPAQISDESDGQLAHLHGLNLSRAWALGELAAVMPDRADELLSLRNAHISASMGAVSGTHYMVEHWLVAYALLLLTEPERASWLDHAT